LACGSCPGRWTGLGLGWSGCHANNPGLLYCSISAYGQAGPRSGVGGFDLTMQAAAGVMSVTGEADGAPVKCGVPLSDMCSGLYAAFAIVAVLRRVEKGGMGEHIDISMLESLAEWMSYPMYYAYDGAPPPPRTAASHASIYPYGPFAAGDGNTVMLGLQNEREWTAFCALVLRAPELAVDPRFDRNALRNENREALKAEILRIFSHLTAAQVVQPQAHGFCPKAPLPPVAPLSLFAPVSPRPQIR